MSSDNSVSLIILGIEVKILVKDLDQAGAYGFAYYTKRELHLAETLTEKNALAILCHEISHILYAGSRDPEGASMTNEDFCNLSEHWAGIIPQINMLHFLFSEAGTLEDVVQLHEVEDIDN